MRSLAERFDPDVERLERVVAAGALPADRALDIVGHHTFVQRLRGNSRGRTTLQRRFTLRLCTCVSELEGFCNHCNISIEIQKPPLSKKGTVLGQESRPFLAVLLSSSP